MKRLILILILAPLGLFAQDRVKFVVSGLTCSMCSLSVQNELKRDKDLKGIDPDLQTQTWYARYEVGKFSVEGLKKRIADAGFTLERAWLNDKLVYERKRSAKKRERKRLVRDLARK